MGDSIFNDDGTVNEAFDSGNVADKPEKKAPKKEPKEKIKKKEATPKEKTEKGGSKAFTYVAIGAGALIVVAVVFVVMFLNKKDTTEDIALETQTQIYAPLASSSTVSDSSVDVSSIQTEKPQREMEMVYPSQTEEIVTTTEVVYEDGIVIEEELSVNEETEVKPIDTPTNVSSDTSSSEKPEEEQVVEPPVIEPSSDYSDAQSSAVNDYSGMTLASGTIISGLDLVNFVNGNPQYFSFISNMITDETMSYVNGGATLSDIPATAMFKVEVTPNGYVFTQIEA